MIKGTEMVADLAEKYNADNFVLISTDKAVEPISVMGAMLSVVVKCMCMKMSAEIKTH